MTGPNVSYGAETTAPPPFRCEGTRLWAYMLEADPDLLGALCARVFAGPSGGAMGYRPIGGHVLVTFGEVPRIVSLAAGFEDQGSVIERQVGIWVAVSEERTGRLKVFTPHMIVDNPMSFASGREVFGYNKSWGWITLPDDEGSEGCAVDVYGGNFGPTEVRGRHRLLEIRAGSGAPEVDEPHHWGDVRGVVSHLRGLVGSAASDIIGEEVAQIFLKQVRAVAGGDGTDLQEICEATIKVDRLVGWPLLREYSAVVQPLDSHPLGPELGIGSQRVLGGFRVHDLVFVLDAGEVIWPTVVDLTASGESGDGAKRGTSLIRSPTGLGPPASILGRREHWARSGSHRPARGDRGGGGSGCTRDNCGDQRSGCSVELGQALLRRPDSQFRTGRAGVHALGDEARRPQPGFRSQTRESVVESGQRAGAS